MPDSKYFRLCRTYIYIFCVLLFLFSSITLYKLKTIISLWVVQEQAVGRILLTSTVCKWLEVCTSLLLPPIANSWDLCFDKSLGWLVFIIKYAQANFSWESSLVQCSYFPLVSACSSMLLCGLVAHQGQGSGSDGPWVQAMQSCFVCRKL